MDDHPQRQKSQQRQRRLPPLDNPSFKIAQNLADEAIARGVEKVLAPPFLVARHQPRRGNVTRHPFHPDCEVQGRAELLEREVGDDSASGSDLLPLRDRLDGDVPLDLAHHFDRHLRQRQLADRRQQVPPPDVSIGLQRRLPQDLPLRLPQILEEFLMAPSASGGDP